MAAKKKSKKKEEGLATSIVVVKNPIEEKLKVLQSIADANESFAKSQIMFAESQKALVDKMGSMSLLGVRGSNHTIQNCVFKAEASTGAEMEY